MAMVTDPVCGMQVDTSLAPAQSLYEGRPYYFCSLECKRTFDENPKECLNQAQQSQGSSA